MTVELLIGDSTATMRAMPPNSVDFIMCSPPFLQLRRYLPPGHELESLDVGQLTTPGEFIDALLNWTEACAHVLAPHGSIYVELGDSSSESGGAGGDYRHRDERHDRGGLRAGQPKFAGTAAAARLTKTRSRSGDQVPNHATSGEGWPLGKSLAMIPELYRVALAYGLNPLTGRRTDPWIIRNVVTWARTNPSPGKQFDKWRRGTSTFVMATKSRNRWWDDQETRKAPSSDSLDTVHRTGGAPPLDWFVQASRTYRSTGDRQHYAAYPVQLCRDPILAMCPPRVCTWCGQAPHRIVEPSATYAAKLGQSIYPKAEHDRQLVGRHGSHEKNITGHYVHVGWAECDCPDTEGRWRRGVVLDPFAGTGTTLLVADQLDRDAIGIDFDERNALLVTERISHATTRPGVLPPAEAAA